ncbi:snf7-like protein [Leishmania tarentolae]|uniref:Snf7-like protein n=1 Tax=Leishmania tarentolae TaxID=5689 RepID=A0A640KV69_LEITA|nr:snf7-like protein [Leishmania tarentolae]
MLDVPRCTQRGHVSSATLYLPTPIRRLYRYFHCHFLTFPIIRLRVAQRVELFHELILLFFLRNLLLLLLWCWNTRGTNARTIHLTLNYIHHHLVDLFLELCVADFVVQCLIDRVVHDLLDQPCPGHFFAHRHHGLLDFLHLHKVVHLLHNLAALLESTRHPHLTDLVLQLHGHGVHLCFGSVHPIHCLSRANHLLCQHPHRHLVILLCCLFHRYFYFGFLATYLGDLKLNFALLRAQTARPLAHLFLGRRPVEYATKYRHYCSFLMPLLLS